MKADYTMSRVSRYAEHPFIEAQPPLPPKIVDIVLSLKHYPPKPSAAIWEADEVTRVLELQCLSDVVYPFPFYEQVALAFATMMRESYVARHPFDPIDQQRRHAIASAEEDGVPFPPGWKSSGQGFSLIALSGMSKTTLINSFFMHYPQIIEHSDYKNHSLSCLQLLYLILRVPHDATLRGFCLNFFSEVDSLIGTKYHGQAESIRTIAPMVSLMRTVATACSTGIIIVDEVQNVRLATRPGASMMLNLFSELIETIGLSLVIVGTPAVGRTLRRNALNARKLASAGSRDFPLLDSQSPIWKSFCKLIWAYRYTKVYVPLTPKIMNVWHYHCAGNIAFAVLLYWLAQRESIGGTERVDEHTFELVSKTAMATLQPAISYLRSRKTESKSEFEDLLFATDYDQLFSQFGGTTAYPSKPHDYDEEEFEDYGEPNDSSDQTKRGRPRVHASTAPPELPVEQPIHRK
ncbi:ATP-binding protein [Cupriavidus sp. UYPR2.512]|uniref:ATP-binding protein n=1 Tax=Cupriavidus sp. UYPR2.512 TaxID=1080187 RepID=UPI0007C7F9F2|nr:ATP-binding protein [Cupriavidus sp. UYPR2.512]UIF90066.1 ATP-binding protein [Cupriavidus necator]